MHNPPPLVFRPHDWSSTFFHRIIDQSYSLSAVFYSWALLNCNTVPVVVAGIDVVVEVSVVGFGMSDAALMMTTVFLSAADST